MTSQPITISPTGSSSPGNNNNRNNNKHYSNSMRRFRSAMSTMSLSSSTPRKPDIHIETRQGKHHADDGIPNQDMAFALTRYELAPSSTTTTQSSSGHGSNSPFRFVNGGSGNVSGNGNGKKRRRVAAAGVFDGHGIDGHSASRLACKRMECAVDTLLANYYSSINVNNNAEETTTTTTIDDRDDNGRLAGVLEKAFRETAAMLDGATCGNGSGTTGSVVAIYGDDVCMSWVGDSVIVVIDDTPNIRFASPMHRVTDDTEAARILSAGGRIQDGYVVDTDAKNGIAVTRTLGDVDMHQYGCTSEPQTMTMKLKKDDAVIIIASDGLWDTDGITTDSVLRIATDRRKRTSQRICQQLMDAVEDADGPLDDCTIACMTLK